MADPSQSLGDLNGPRRLGHLEPNFMRTQPTLARYLVAIGLLLSAPHVFAAPAPVASEPGTEVVPQVLWLEVTPGSSRLDPEAVRVAIESELGLPTSPSTMGPYLGRVQIEGTSGSAVIVRFESADGTTKLERRVTLPVDAN